jgi:hypothetical protein
MTADAEQLRLDLEDANKRLDLMRQAIAERDEAELAVKAVQRQLVQAKRRAKEAGWKLSVLMQSERAKSPSA